MKRKGRNGGKEEEKQQETEERNNSKPRWNREREREKRGD